MPDLTLGPVLFHWPAEKLKDFYFQIADEAPVDAVYLGETICAKRAPFFAPFIPEVVARLEAAGKKVILSSLAAITTPKDRAHLQKTLKEKDREIEANDLAALHILSGSPHRIGPFVNVYNEDTLAFLTKRGATYFTLPPELPQDVLAALGGAAQDLDVTLETIVFGRVPLALSGRCYHARAADRRRDNCRYACENDPDGLSLKTLDGQDFLTINGIQTLSHPCLNMIHELSALQACGIRSFRLSPHTCNMIEVAKIFRAVLDGGEDPACAETRLRMLWPDTPHANGFFYGREGFRRMESVA